jgi:hypothetical protein
LLDGSQLCLSARSKCHLNLLCMVTVVGAMDATFDLALVDLR